jgi:predicted dehydrogenase
MGIIRWGVIGAGDIVVRRVAPAIVELENCEFTAITRDRSELAERSARELGAKRWYPDWREMLVDGEIDAVYIATPVHLHAEQTIAAAEAGKHVLCEKPMALDPGECVRMIDAGRERDVRLGIAYYRRFYPVLARVREVLATGEIGKPVVAQMNAFEYLNMNADGPRGWFLQKAKSGGGPMMDFGCHRLEVLIDLFGEVNKTSSLVSNTYFEREVEDTATALLEFDSGTSASVTVTHAARESRDTLDIYGTRGSIHVPVLNKGAMTVRTDGGEREEHHPPHRNVHLPLISDFAEAIANGTDVRVNGSTGLEVAGLIEKIYRG